MNRLRAAAGRLGTRLANTRVGQAIAGRRRNRASRRGGRSYVSN